MIKEIIESVKEAGEIFKRGFGNTAYNKKGVVDLVTKYDIEIENFLKDRLGKLEIPILGEEGRETLNLKEAIVIDPIDGTTNYIHNIPFCSISVGVIKNREFFGGVVYNPLLNELFFAQKGQGAYLNREKIRVSSKDNLIDSLIATGFPYAKYKEGKEYFWSVDTFRKILPKTRDIRRLGSASLDICYCATGRFDGFYELGLEIWDVAAAIAILKESGGIALNEIGEKYYIGDRVIVCGNSIITKELIKYMERL
ncbi:MAG: inositol monophosphatase [Epsilonproteobacteria bacterium]|nr:inositol monophosphatase [Campylobacterota bacterium]